MVAKEKKLDEQKAKKSKVADKEALVAAQQSSKELEAGSISLSFPVEKLIATKPLHSIALDD